MDELTKAQRIVRERTLVATMVQRSIEQIDGGAAHYVNTATRELNYYHVDLPRDDRPDANECGCSPDGECGFDWGDVSEAFVEGQLQRIDMCNWNRQWAAVRKLFQELDRYVRVLMADDQVCPSWVLQRITQKERAIFGPHCNS